MMCFGNFQTLHKPEINKRCTDGVLMPQSPGDKGTRNRGNRGCWYSWCLQRPPLPDEVTLARALQSDLRQRNKNPLVSKLPVDEAGNGGAETERKTEAQCRTMFGGSTKSGTRSQES